LGRIIPTLTRRLFGKKKKRPFPDPRWGVEVEYSKRKDVLILHDYDSFQGRNSATIGLFLQAFRQVRGRLKSFQVFLDTWDQPCRSNSEVQFAYCRSDDQTRVILMPDFIFWAWPEVGIADYAEMTSQMLAAGAEKPADDRLFWIGNPRTHESRQVLLDLAEGKPNMKIEPYIWPKSKDAGRFRSSPFVSLPDHCRYKYLIDVQGFGYSARLKVLFFSRRLLFLQERPWHEFFFADLVPFRHYVPVAPMFEDLEEKLEWARTHEAEAEEIAAAGTDFAKQHLTREAAIKYFRKLLFSNFGP
jgi:Glycosyl transferase family 90